MTKQAQHEAWSGVRDVSPLAAGVVIYGLAFGLLAAQAGMSGLQVGLMGAFVFGGASQIVAVERLAAGAGAAAAIIAGLALNLRLFLVTASIRDIYADRPLWQVVLGAHLATDENWALTIAQRSAGRDVGYWYLVGAGVLLMIAWVGSTVAGASFATAIPEPRAYGMDFAFTAAFLAIARSLWRGAADFLPWAVSIAIVIVTVGSDIIDPSWAIILGGISGATLAGLRARD